MSYKEHRSLRPKGLKIADHELIAVAEDDRREPGYGWSTKRFDEAFRLVFLAPLLVQSKMI